MCIRDRGRTALVQPAGVSAPAAAPLSANNQAGNTQPQGAGNTTPRGAAATPAASAAPAAGSGGTALANGTVTGPVVQTRFGSVQVQVTIAGGKITDVTALQLPSDRQRSAEISGIVGPMLQSEALAAQSAQIDLISGATYTSPSPRDRTRSRMPSSA